MDKYANYKELSAHQQIGKDYTIHIQYALPDIVILAIHGGRIEAGTSEIARGIAGERWSFYDFRGKKKKNNRDLHITSTCFDEPRALNLVSMPPVWSRFTEPKATNRSFILAAGMRRC